MSAVFDPAGDFAAVADATEAITLTSPSGAKTAVGAALRRAVTEREAAASQGKYTRADVKWHVPRSQSPAAPAIGATITDAAGGVWTVLKVEQDVQGDRFALWTRRLAIAEGLTEIVHVQTAAWSKDAQGAAAATWNLAVPNVAARIQVVEGSLSADQGRPALRVLHRIYLARQIELTASMRIFHPATGQAYRILRVTRPQRLDELLTVEAEKVPA
jgi:head-tail adaptor